MPKQPERSTQPKLTRSEYAKVGGVAAALCGVIIAPNFLWNSSPAEAEHAKEQPPIYKADLDCTNSPEYTGPTDYIAIAYQPPASGAKTYDKLTFATPGQEGKPHLSTAEITTWAIGAGAVTATDIRAKIKEGYYQRPFNSVHNPEEPRIVTRSDISAAATFDVPPNPNDQSITLVLACTAQDAEDGLRELQTS